MMGTAPKVVVIPHLGTFGEVGEREILERAACDVVVLPTRDEAAAIAVARQADAVICPPHLSERFIAALDVFEREPVAPDNPLLRLPNVVATPHMSSLSAHASIERRLRPAYEVAAVLTGHRPRSVWNRAVLEKVSLK